MPFVSSGEVKEVIEANSNTICPGEFCFADWAAAIGVWHSGTKQLVSVRSHERDSPSSTAFCASFAFCFRRLILGWEPPIERRRAASRRHAGELRVAPGARHC